MATKSQAYLDFALRFFAKQFIRNRKEDILKANLKNSASLIDSLFAVVENQPDANIFKMLVSFNTYGRIQDMAVRRVSYRTAGGEEMIEYLSAWAMRKGIDKFKKGKYASRYNKLTDQQAANKIAWGIVKSLQGKGKKKKRSWYNKQKTRDIEIFYSDLLIGYSEKVLEEIKVIKK